MSAQHERPATGRPGLILLASLLGLFIALLDVTVVNVALPTIREDLGASLGDLQWVANAYLLALAVLIVTAGRLGDVYGQRKIFIIGVAVFVVGSLLCGAAKDLTLFGSSHITVLHAGRVVQGLGGAVILPLSLAMIYSSFTGRMRALGVILWGAVGGVATAIGPLIGGWLVEDVNWQSIFLINAPLGLIAIAAAALGLGGRRPAAAGARRSLDVGGLVTISAALLCLNLALINGEDWGWTSGRTLALFGGTVVLTVLFLVVESQVAQPIMTLSWFRRPSFAGSVVAGLLLGAGMFSFMFYLSIYLQNGLHLTAMETGVRMLPMTVILIAGAPTGGILAKKLGVRAVLTGTFLAMAASLALFTRLDPEGDAGSWTLLLPGMLVGGFCLGVIMPMVSELTIAAGPDDQIGVSSSVGTMFRQIGNSIGIAIMGALLTAQINQATDDTKALVASGKATPATIAHLQSATIGHATEHMAWFGATLCAAAAVLTLLMVRNLAKPATDAADPNAVPQPVFSAG
jgi:EmrB/QacA subfamily drug resistance transporter